MDKLNQSYGEFGDRMLRVLYVLIIIIEYLAETQSKLEATRDIHIDTGIVRGHLAKDGETPYYAFLGIPYAAPMIAKNRFKAPFPRAPWDGIFIANRTVMCVIMRRNESEDCLVVNVFTPVEKKRDLTPVLIYIHGGGHSAGLTYTSAAANLIQQDLIIVTMTYRLNALGFLCLGIDKAPGNAGLKDQTAALRWVQRNIRHFGGDPNQVTLYGRSSGGAYVELHVLSKMSKGLFQRAIVESASAMSVWVANVDPISTALNFAENYLRLPRRITNDLNKLVHYLQLIPAGGLFRQTWRCHMKLSDGTFGMSPCVERESNGTESFISKSPEEILTKREYTRVPIMFVFATAEGMYFKNFQYHDSKQKMKANFVDFLPADLVFDTEETKQEVGRSINNFYFGNETVGDEAYKIQYLNYFGDHLVMHGLLNSALMHARDDNPVYLMEFAYRGLLGYTDKTFKNINMSAHADFGKYVFAKKTSETKERLAVGRVAKLLANFVRFGDPTPAQTQLLPVAWPRVQLNNVTYLRMGEEFSLHKLKDSPYWARKVFWDVLYDKYSRRILPVNPNRNRL